LHQLAPDIVLAGEVVVVGATVVVPTLVVLDVLVGVVEDVLVDAVVGRLALVVGRAVVVVVGVEALDPRSSAAAT
jgi:hypothetical protein